MSGPPRRCGTSSVRSPWSVERPTLSWTCSPLPAEFNRVLRPTGRLIVVRPRRQHLAELRNSLPVMVAVDPAKEQRLHRALSPFFEAVMTEEVERIMPMTRQQALDLVGMTPTARHLGQEDLNDGALLPDHVTVSVLATAYQPR